MNRSGWRNARLIGGAAILAIVVWRVGSGPFVSGAGRIDAWSLAAGTAIAVPITLCCAWRWRLVARGLGVDIPLRASILSYYRSQFLNTALPGGVLGDVHRGVHHGRDVGQTGRSLRAVAWERVAGQVVQVAIAVLVLVLLPSPVRSSMPGIASAVAVALVVGLLLGQALPSRGTSLWARALHVTRSDLRSALLARHAWPGIVLTSAVAVAGHVATFFVAARTAGISVAPQRMLPLALLVLLAMAIPANIAGWGPREGMAAWAFAAAGLGAGEGVATAVVYGVIVFVAGLPGAVVLVASWLRSSTRAEASVNRREAARG
jgi:hypothetical protein